MPEFEELNTDIWSEGLFPHHNVWRVIPTNGDVNRHGRAIMGRGLAKQVAYRYPGITDTLGHILKNHGNNVATLWGVSILTFPVKKHWDESADLELIRRSCRQLCSQVEDIRSLSGIEIKVLVPRVGCGNGNLDWEEVGPVVRNHLRPIADKVVLIYTDKFEGR